MAAYDITLELDGPLLAGEPRQGNTYSSYAYLPGSVLRGAAAAALMTDWTAEEREKSHPEQCDDPANCDFCRVFAPQNGRSPRFYDCFPVMNVGDPVYPFPVTAGSCKRHPGFRYEDDPEDNHGVLDTLVQQVAARDAMQANQLLSYIFTADCPICGKTLKSPPADHYSLSDDTYYIATPQNRRFSRTAINRRRHTAQNGQLFTLDVMGEQSTISLPKVKGVRTQLQGIVDGGDADPALLQRALNQIQWLGSGTSRGLGRISECTVSQRPFPQSEKPVSEYAPDMVNGRFSQLAQDKKAPEMVRRIAEFNQVIMAEREFYKVLDMSGVLNGRWYFTIDLLSHTYLRHQGLPTLQLTAEMLKLEGAAVDFVAVDSIERGGWSDAWGLPRYRQVGIVRGSVFLFRVDSDDPAVTAALLERLAELEQEGIGVDRERGAGRLLVCAPFHKEVNPK
jgi:CRISPR-associated Csx10 family RAMP protein